MMMAVMIAAMTTVATMTTNTNENTYGEGTTPHFLLRQFHVPTSGSIGIMILRKSEIGNSNDAESRPASLDRYLPLRCSQ